MTRPRLRIAILLALGALAALPVPARAQPGWSDLARGGLVVLFRHARAPGTGDPPGFRLDDCATQRNLSEQGRREARRIGEAFREQRVPVEVVLTSRWCRARDTARLAFGDLATDAPFLDSFFSAREQQAAQTAALRGFVASRADQRGVSVLFTHQVNITALTGIVPAEGEAVLLRPDPQGFTIVGRLRP